jgi:hypothetical protein
MVKGMGRVLCRTTIRDNVPTRRLHDSLGADLLGIFTLGAHRPAVGCIQARINNWETLARRARGYRNYPYQLTNLRLITANPVGDE